MKEEEDTKFVPNRKERRMERKLAISKDRSKYKKTDQAKYLQGLKDEQALKIAKQDWLKGRVLSIISRGIIVDYEGQKIVCVLKGLMKKDRTSAKNLVAVGDFVLFEKTGEGEGIIAHVLPRETILSRADNLSRRKEQLIAVNIDQVIITVSVVSPALKPPLIDRYIIAACKGGMKPVLLINKIDLFDTYDDEVLVEDEQHLYQELLKAYGAIGIPVIAVSSETGAGMDQLRAIMSGKASVFSGQSGVGKSSLINSVTGLDLKVGETVERTQKGSHTTTSTQLIPLAFGGWCIDTPGIKSFGVWDLKADEIEGYFSEIHELGKMCKFPDCTHSHETDCAVIMALEEGNLSPVRFDSYQALMQSVAEGHRRR
jgi:ribosome biogenesis GTPase